jgi:hypothetical protein
MKQLVINQYEKITVADINDLQSSIYQGFQDTVLYNFFQKVDGCVGTGFKANRTSATSVTLTAGSGFMWDSSQTGYNPKYRQMVLTSDLVVAIGAAHATYNRYDIICIKPNTVTTNENRYVKTNGTGAITLTSVQKLKTDSYSVQVVAGTAAASPSVPATPSGWMKVADILVTAAVGISSAVDIADSRNVLLPYLPRIIPDRTVSPSGYGTDRNFTTAIAALTSGGTILVTENVTLTSSVSITNPNIKIISVPNATITGSAIVGFKIQSSGVRINGLRMSGFSTAIQIDNGYNNCFITENRFASCTNDVVDNNTTPNNVINLNITE